MQACLLVRCPPHQHTLRTNQRITGAFQQDGGPIDRDDADIIQLYGKHRCFLAAPLTEPADGESIVDYSKVSVSSTRRSSDSCS